MACAIVDTVKFMMPGYVATQVAPPYTDPPDMGQATNLIHPRATRIRYAAHAIKRLGGSSSPRFHFAHLTVR